MNQLYRAIGTSKQNVYQRLDHQFERMEQEAQLEKVVHQIRQDHPRMGAARLIAVVWFGFLIWWKALG